MPKVDSIRYGTRGLLMAASTAVTTALMSLLLTALPVQGQQAGLDKEKLVQAQKQNAAALMQYTWKSRTELKLKGESKSVKLDQVRYDLNGKIQKTPVGGTPEKAEPEQKAAGGRRDRVKEKIIENKKEEFADLMQQLAQLVISYGHIPPDKMQAFAQGATIKPGEGTLAGTVSIQGKNVLQPEDSLTIWLDPSTLMMRHIEIATILEKKPVHVVVEYASVQDGPSYQARANVTYPDKEIDLTVDNYDYQRVGS